MSTATAVKEIGVPFKGDMVLAIKACRKTRTRRPCRRSDGDLVIVDYGNGWWPYKSMDGESLDDGTGNETPLRCPLGVPGSLLYVKETVLYSKEHANHYYAADRQGVGNEAHFSLKSKSYPSIFMPKRLARIWLKNTEVRCVRLQDMSRHDAYAEGIDWNEPQATGWWHTDPVGAYAKLWDSLYPATPWASNPWCWDVTFSLTTKPAEANA